MESPLRRTTTYGGIFELCKSFAFFNSQITGSSSLVNDPVIEAAHEGRNDGRSEGRNEAINEAVNGAVNDTVMIL